MATRTTKMEAGTIAAIVFGCAFGALVLFLGINKCYERRFDALPRDVKDRYLELRPVQLARLVYANKIKPFVVRNVLHSYTTSELNEYHATLKAIKNDSSYPHDAIDDISVGMGSSSDVNEDNFA